MPLFLGNLRAFHEVIRAGSIRKASEALGVAPSSVSRQIAILEREMGTALFHRRAGGVELTHAGACVAEYAGSALLDYDTLRTDLDDLRGVQRRLIRIALVESIAGHGPVRAIAAFRKAFGAVTFNVRLMPTPNVVESVRQGQFDVGLGFCLEPDADLTILARVPDPIVVVTSADHPLAARKRATIEALAQWPLALPDANFGVRLTFDRAAAAAGLRLTPVLSSNIFEIMLDFARTGAGVAVMPVRGAAHEIRRGALRAVPLAGAVFEDCTIDVAVLRKRRLPRVVKAFVETLVSEVSDPASLEFDRSL
jgi:DNA-binding transcriptional LysR family regulator